MLMSIIFPTILRLTFHVKSAFCASVDTCTRLCEHVHISVQTEYNTPRKSKRMSHLILNKQLKLTYHKHSPIQKYRPFPCRPNHEALDQQAASRPLPSLTHCGCASLRQQSKTNSPVKTANYSVNKQNTADKGRYFLMTQNTT